MTELLTGEVRPIANRSLTADTCEKYGYKIGQYRGRAAHIAPYYDDDTGMVCAQKVRFKQEGKKAFTWTGEPKRAGLFGQRLCRSGGKMLVITEGEIDAMSVAQAMGLRWPAVSIPNGASNAKKDLAKHMAWLDSFETVVICFDMDEVGQTAAREVAAMFTPGKIKIASLPLKDASDMLTANRSAELVDAIWGARIWRPDGVRTVADLRQDAMKPTEYGLPWPWADLTLKTYGIQRRYAYGWGAGVGSGKTTLMRQLMLTTMRPDLLEDHSHIIDGYGKPLERPAPRKVGAVLFEENPGKTLRYLAGMSLKLRLNDPTVEVTEEALSAAIDSFDGLFFPIDCYGAKDWEAIRSYILYLVLSEGVKDVFLDPLTALVAGEEDERRALDTIMADISGMVEAHDFTLHFVSHLTTPAGTPHEEGGRIFEKHFTGSRAIARWSHCMIGLERNKQENEDPTKLRFLKYRDHGDRVGILLGLKFNTTTGLMEPCPLDEDGGCPFDKEQDNNADL
ncbi:toprim domain-containing protein [Novosphingobium umbonatum]|uniref:Toprim domain-containing protein n=1 Tax=Novosphingobium umbonatum TaxID=1908524 RepID=A0A3S2V4X8_9SPHN|nr:toprim domain-containing protein [Novosphingobium umbonatum]RVU03572.1 toprim domain-containing protein [Novosphingobium umbonatum]